MSNFIISAAEEKASLPFDPKMMGFKGVPTFFRAGCFTASQGGANGYFDVGWHLGLNTAELLDTTADHLDLVMEKLDELRTLLDEQNEEAIIDWYERQFPSCMEWVPERRRSQFVKGVLAIDEDRTVTDL